ncbi:hypothetical protein BECAL_01359 [Bellilinea caldifistulae]|uniref:Uncharacterized protein n=1 Tax=Bellilinea caldifistulae TaxID=360411 RepID=A0A0N8GN63_9CHLR|nr:hypothetical protein [Bellilinea caldifistulae]KPL77218.1 hypothetical protein AC812_04500 [Bellilinea caldifistulae]GAP10196.1 hypothetical protein BECAL_01359 [Bellilinea caldifistulae]
MAVVTRKGLKLAARNLAALPFRVLLFAFEWVLRLTIIAVLVFVLAVGGVGWYFYTVKANQPMQIDPRFARTLPPEGMTFREFWQDRFAGWEKIDERDYRTGKSKSKSHCVKTELEVFPQAHILAPFLRVYFVRTQPGTAEAESWIRGMKGIIAPDDLNFVDA